MAYTTPKKAATLTKLVAIILLFSISGVAQRNAARLLFCNQNDTVRDTKNLPRSGYRQDKEIWGQWDYAVSDQKGRYVLSVVSRKGFNPYLYQLDNRGNWRLITLRSTYRTMRDRRGSYFVWQLLDINQIRTPRGQRRLRLLVRPVDFRQQSITASWRTTRCEKSGGGRSRVPSCSWQRSETGLYGTIYTYRCVCNGRAVANKDAVRRCGRRPR